MYVEHIYWGYNYANNANKQKGPALGLIQSILTISQWEYHCTSMSFRHKYAAHFHCLFTSFWCLVRWIYCCWLIELNHPICVTEHLFQLQKQTCGHHSKSRITTAIDSQCLFKGAIDWFIVSVFARTHTCMVKTLIVHITKSIFLQPNW